MEPSKGMTLETLYTSLLFFSTFKNIYFYDYTDDVLIKEPSKKLDCSKNTDTPIGTCDIQDVSMNTIDKVNFIPSKKNPEESSKKLDTSKNTDTPKDSSDIEGAPNNDIDKVDSISSDPTQKHIQKNLTQEKYRYAE